MSNAKRVLVTGAGGFVGRHVVTYLASSGFEVVAASRAPYVCDRANVTHVLLPDLSEPVDWSPLLQNCHAVVHLAGIAHKQVPDEMHDLVNHRATAALADAAVACGVDHLIFVSSIAAQCGPFSYNVQQESDTPQPLNAYGRSKLAAETAVRLSGAVFTILRPVAIHGEGEKGNFAIVQKFSRSFLPLPFGKLTNLRSVLSINNFCSVIGMALTNPRTRMETFVVADPTPVTVGDVVARYRANLGRSPGLLPIPSKWLEYSLIALGQRALWERLGCPLVVKPAKLIEAGWVPPETF